MKKDVIRQIVIDYTGDIMEIPKFQTIALTYYPTDNKSKYYIITKDKYDKYYLYSVDKNKLTKLKTADSPLKFKECYP